MEFVNGSIKEAKDLEIYPGGMDIGYKGLNKGSRKNRSNGGYFGELDHCCKNTSYKHEQKTYMRGRECRMLSTDGTYSSICRDFRYDSIDD